MTDLGLPPVAVGPLQANARRALAYRQVDSRGDTDQRIGLPAETALAFLDRAWELGRATQAFLAQRDARQLSRPAALVLLSQLRPLLCSVVGFVFCNRAGTTQSALFEDLSPASFGPDGRGLLTFRLRTRKGKAQDRRFRVVTIPVDSRQPTGVYFRLSALLALFKTVKLLATPSYARGGSKLWALPGDSGRYDASLQTRWLQDALAAVGRAAPAGYVYLSHSLRIGAASAAAAIDVPDHKIRFVGGWAPGSTTIVIYVDPTVQPSAAGRAFFGYLLGAQHPG